MRGGGKVQVKAPEDTAAVPVKFQTFVKEEVLVGIYNVRICFSLLMLSIVVFWKFMTSYSCMQDVFSSTPEQFLNLLLADDSTYTNEYRSARKDKNLNVSFDITI